nr:hypothetical protein [Tanacetum cinerariifolium]
MSDLDTISLDDRYNHLKAYESEVQKKSEPNPQNMAFISSAKHNRGNKDVNTASVSTASANVGVASISQDTACAYISSQSSGKKISIQGTNVAGFDKSKVECFNCHKMGHFARECRAPRSQDSERRDNYRQGSKVEEQAQKALMAIDGEGLGYSVVPPPAAQIYSSPKKDMSWTGLPKFKDDTVTDYSMPAPTIESLNFVMKKNACFNCGDFNHLAYDCRKRVKKGTSRSQNNTHKRFTPRPAVHKPYRPPMRPMGSNMNGARPNRTSFNKPCCSRHMTSNISYLSDYEPFDGGYMSFCQGGYKITGKGTIKPDECMIWHRRLGHVNFKTMNKLVRHNLVRGLPTKCFKNDHTCTACLKAKQHKASCKSKLVNSVSKPLHTLYMDLFGPTSDETSGILRKFITEIENLKVKIIRCDNGGYFKNKEINDFCSQKRIKREFSNARTPQQNGVAERRNMTLIEAARTMLADAKLPVTF